MSDFDDFDDQTFRVARASFARGAAPGAKPRFTASHYVLPHDQQGLPEWTETSHVGRLYDGRQVPRVSEGATAAERQKKERLVDRVRQGLKNVLYRFRG